MANLKYTEQRVEKLEIALVMLLNCLRTTQKIGDETVVAEVPAAMLDRLEKMILTRPS